MFRLCSLFTLNCVFLLVKGIGSKNCSTQPSSSQLLQYAMDHDDKIDVLTTTSGMPVSVQSTSTLSKSLIRNSYYQDLVTHLYRERIPERTLHGRGTGAYGYFEVTHDVSNICKSKVFNGIGQKTKVLARFSPAVSHRSASDTRREPRGAGLKFYTSQGNLDLVMFNIPIFFVNDPIVFPMLIHSFNPSPVHFMPDYNQRWDLLVNYPESFNFLFRLAMDAGIADGYRRMHWFGIHTMQVTNVNNETRFVRFTFSPKTEFKYLTNEKATELAGLDPSYFTRDMFNAIAEKNNPEWTLYFQVLTEDDVSKAEFNVFDLTKELPVDKYPLQPVGRLVMNENVKNYFAEVDQVAFSPCKLVPGFLGSPDKLFEARCIAYRDSSFYRLGVNFDNINVNRPIHKTNTYTRDGVPNTMENGVNAPNYYPNSFNGPKAVDINEPQIVNIVENYTVSFQQSKNLYEALTEDEKDRVAKNILDDLKDVYDFLRVKVLANFGNVHKDIPARIYKKLNTTVSNHC